MNSTINIIIEYIREQSKEFALNEEDTIDLYRFKEDGVEYELQFIIEEERIYGMLVLCDVYDTQNCFKNEAVLLETIDYYRDEHNTHQEDNIRSILIALLEIKENIHQYTLYRNKRGLISFVKKKAYDFKIHASHFFDGDIFNCYICKEPCLRNEHLNQCNHNIHIKCAIQLYNHDDRRKLTCGICRREYPKLSFYKHIEEDE